MPLFRNKILLRAYPPFSSFSLLQLSLLPSPSSLSPLSLRIHSLCWKLSRQFRLACFSDSSHIYIVYQKRTQFDSAAQAVKEFKEALPISDVMEVVSGDGEVMSGSLISKAVDCSLRALFLESNWKCLGDGSIVYSDFSSCEEKNHLFAVHVTMQVDTDDSFVILVSPDVVQFSRHKIKDLLSSEMQQRFQAGEEVILDDFGFESSCSILPSLHEGHVLGLSRHVPAVEEFEHMDELWSFKHGLSPPNDYFMSIQLTCGGHTTKQWFPSAFILQGSGLNPVRQTIRASNSIRALESFMEVIKAWNFFDGGLLKIKGACRLGPISDISSWTKATNKNTEQFSNSLYLQATIDGKAPSFEGLLSNNDFRTPKPASRFFGSKASEQLPIQGRTVSLSKGNLDETCARNEDVVSVRTISKLRPLFMDRAPARRIIHSGNISDQTFHLSLNKSKTMNLHKDDPFQKSLPNCNFAKEKKGSPDVSRSSKRLKQKEVQKGLNNCLTDTKKVLTTEAPGEILCNKAGKSRDAEHDMPRKRAKHHADTSDLTTKIIAYHAKGQLVSLTVQELKSFLSMRKSKVGGKKEDLIQRVMSLLASSEVALLVPVSDF